MDHLQNACSKCGKHNISYQIVQTKTTGNSVHSLSGNKRHGLFYWLFIGIWWEPMLWFFRTILKICTLGILGRRRNKMLVGKTVTTTKSINCTMAVCQNCGHTWKV